MFRVDLHTHSIASPDGGVTARQYRQLLQSGTLDCIAVTDHNRIDFAQDLQAEMGERIIIGEEIMSSQGEIVGLYLNELVPAGLSAQDTISAIKAQDGIVYIPHPFETIRKGLHPSVLDELVTMIDIVEVCNGRALIQNRSQQAVVWARINHVLGAASSDAHGIRGLGRTYSGLAAMPNRDTLLELLKTGTLITDRPGIRALLYPKFNRARKKLRRQQ